MLSLLFSVLIGIHYISANPAPLVSSSGMISLTQPSEKHQEESKDEAQAEDAKADPIKDPLPLLRDEKETEVFPVDPAPDIAPGEDMHIVRKKSVPPDMFSLSSVPSQQDEHGIGSSIMDTSSTSLDMQPDPLQWGRMRSRPKVKVDSLDRTDNFRSGAQAGAKAILDQEDDYSKESQPDNVAYTPERKSVLHPYDASSAVTIPTLVITAPTPTIPPHTQNTVRLPQGNVRKPIAMNSGIHRNETSSHESLIEGGQASKDNSSEILINDPKFYFVDQNHLHNEDIFEDLEAPMRIPRTSNNTDGGGSVNATTEIPKPDNSTTGGGSGGINATSELNVTVVKSNAPWEDDEIVGKLIEDPMIDPVEVSFKVASRLCRKIGQGANHYADTRKRYYLWAPINQYLPLLHKAFPVRPPLFAPECLKFVLRQCRGTIRLPLLKPCTYWAPMPIRRPECGFNPNLHSMIVNYRLPEYVPGNCPCVWPCTQRFDPIQRCSVTINETERLPDQIHSDGEPWSDKELIIQENLAAQLCRGMKLAMAGDHIVPIGWIPIRADLANSGEPEPEGEADESATNKRKRKRRESGNGLKKKKKREQIFLNPDKPVEDSEEEGADKDKDDRFILMGTYNLDRQLSQNTSENITTIRKCNVWKYRACSRAGLEGASDEILEEGNLRRRKRSLPAYMSRLALVDGGVSQSLIDKKRIVRQSVIDDDDDILFQQSSECGEWVRLESYRCIPEDHIFIPLRPPDSSSEETNNEDQKKLVQASQKKKVIKDLCPGSVGKFPCFLRKKRDLSAADSNEENVEEKESVGAGEKKVEKRDANADDMPQEAEAPLSLSTYVIDKIQIRPDSSCMCEWPCMPFFDRVNKCFDKHGNVLLDDLGRPKIAARSFRKGQRDPVVCINFVETDEIYCKIKE